MDQAADGFECAGTLEELRAKGQLVLRGRHRPVLVVHDHDRVFALDNRCPHMGFPLDKGTPDTRETWRELITGKLKVVPVPGHHYQIIHEPYAAVLAGELQKSLVAARANHA